jgi:hypothetical protein
MVVIALQYYLLQIEPRTTMMRRKEANIDDTLDNFVSILPVRMLLMPILLALVRYWF